MSLFFLGPAVATAPPGAAPTPISATKAASALHQQQASSSPARGDQQAPAGKPNTPYSAKTQQSPTLIYSSEQGGRGESTFHDVIGTPCILVCILVQPQGRQVGSIADYDPMNGQWGSIASVAAGRPNQPPPGKNSILMCCSVYLGVSHNSPRHISAGSRMG